MAKKIVAVIMMMSLLAAPVQADALPKDMLAAILPGGIAADSAEGNGAVFEAVMPDTGERLEVFCDESGNVVRVETVQPAQAEAAVSPVERSVAEAVVQDAYPDCRILFAEDTGDGKRLGVAAETFCGSITVAEDRIVSRYLEAGEIYLDGVLTPDGARRVLALHRPGISVLELEFDEDDGIFIFEGEANLSGAEYEFELDAINGKLLEWERD